MAALHETLDQRYRAPLVERLMPRLILRVGQRDDTERTKRLLAEGLANGLFNTVLPYFAQYHASLTTAASSEVRAALRRAAIANMLAAMASVAYAHGDLAHVFEELETLAESV